MVGGEDAAVKPLEPLFLSLGGGRLPARRRTGGGPLREDGPRHIRGGYAEGFEIMHASDSTRPQVDRRDVDARVRGAEAAGARGAGEKGASSTSRAGLRTPVKDGGSPRRPSTTTCGARFVHGLTCWLRGSAPGRTRLPTGPRCSPRCATSSARWRGSEPTSADERRHSGAKREPPARARRAGDGAREEGRAAHNTRPPTATETKHHAPPASRASRTRFARACACDTETAIFLLSARPATFSPTGRRCSSCGGRTCLPHVHDRGRAGRRPTPTTRVPGGAQGRARQVQPCPAGGPGAARPSGTPTA